MTGFDTGRDPRQQGKHMAGPDSAAGETRRWGGGNIPGAPGQVAFDLSAPEPSAVPILIAVPHAGRAYAPELVDRMRHPRAAALRLEDRYADLLGEEVARRTGAALLLARAPRAMIDLNRATDDIDWEMFGRGRHPHRATPPGLRARSGLGLIPRRLPGLGEIWKRRHDEPELEERIASIHAPYHACIEDEVARLRQRWGAALLIDLHSMPPLGTGGRHPPSEFVIGDRFGASCHGTLVAAAFGFFAERRRMAGHNRPYAGGYVLDRHAAPHEGVHALQIEVDRSSYLDRALAEQGEGFSGMVDLLSGLVSVLAEHVGAIGRDDHDGRWRVAAE